MKVIGLTGNIGSGKSIVSNIFEVLKVPVYHADAESKKLLQNDDVKSSVRSIFKNVYDENGQVDRKKLATIVFNDQNLLLRLNEILHPLVRENFHQWLRSKTEHPYVLNEAAIIFESGFENEFNNIVLVTCPQEIAIERVIKRDNVTREEVLRRIHTQMPEEKKAALADFLILNDGLHQVIPQVLDLHKRFLKSSS